MLRVGLTGGAAGGKSAVAAMLRERGMFVSESDAVARSMTDPGGPLFRSFVEHFGPAVVASDGRLDRAALAQIAFRDGRVEELNAIVHPPVIRAQTIWMEHVAAEHPEGVAVVESALIFETKFGLAAGGDPAAPWQSRFDCIVVVTAPEPLRLERYIARALASDPLADRALLERDARERFALQWPEERKVAAADYAVRNDSSLQALELAVRDLSFKLRALAEGRAG